jgi:hypothetical protein
MNRRKFLQGLGIGVGIATFAKVEAKIPSVKPVKRIKVKPTPYESKKGMDTRRDLPKHSVTDYEKNWKPRINQLPSSLYVENMTKAANKRRDSVILNAFR